MTNEPGRLRPAPNASSRSSRKHHWWRWLAASVAVLAILAVLAAAAFVKLQPTPSALALPTAAASAPAGPAGGTWNVAAGSTAGFRVRETVLGFSNDMVGRTSAVTGTITLSGQPVTRVTAAAFRIDLATVKVGGKAQPQFARSLGTQDHPDATFTLTRPVTLGPAFTSGAVITATATGQLTMNGTSRRVTFTISGRRDGSALQVAGSAAIAYTDWGISQPKGYGFLGSLAGHGTAEFLFVLHRP